MERRKFLGVLGGAAAWPLGVNARQPSVRRIGVLMGRAADDPDGQEQAAALRRGLEELGWSLGRNLEIEYRWPAGNAGLAQASAKELVELRPDILVANSTPSLIAARAATSTIPIVFVAIADPVAQGFVQSLARPGGNMTASKPKSPAWEQSGCNCSTKLRPASDRPRSSSIRTLPHSLECFCLQWKPPARLLHSS